MYEERKGKEERERERERERENPRDFSYKDINPIESGPQTHLALIASIRQIQFQ
jgi:hypothetical protein